MKQGKKILAIMLTLVLSISMIPSTNVSAAAKVKLNKTKATIYVGKTVTLKLKNNKKKVKWSSSKKKVATVSSKGKVKGKKAGKATITAKVGSKNYKCKVTVKKKVSINSNQSANENTVPNTPTNSNTVTNTPTNSNQSTGGNTVTETPFEQVKSVLMSNGKQSSGVDGVYYYIGYTQISGTTPVYTSVEYHLNSNTIKINLLIESDLSTVTITSTNSATYEVSFWDDDYKYFAEGYLYPAIFSKDNYTYISYTDSNMTSSLYTATKKLLASMINVSLLNFDQIMTQNGCNVRIHDFGFLNY